MQTTQQGQPAFVRGLWVMVMSVVGCTGDGATTFGGTPLTYGLSASTVFDEYALPEQEPVVFIDDEPRDRLEEVYSSYAEAHGNKHVVELRYEKLVISSYEITIADGCDLDPFAIEKLSDSLCVLPTGELRYGGGYSSTFDTTCIGDGFCAARCYPHSCPGQRCSVRITSTVPLATKTACAPIGPRSLGEECTLVEDPDGAYDNCGEGLLCLSGTCTASGGSTRIPGYPPEFGVGPPS